MKKTDLRSRTRVVPVMMVAGVSVVGVGLISDAVVAADVTSVQDTLSITVTETCTFRDVTNLTFTGSALSGSEVENFTNSGVHVFNLFCNSSNGYTVTATPHNLTTTGGIEDIIAYTADYTPSGKNGLWTAEITTNTPDVTATSPVPVGGGTIISSGTNTSASGTTFTATYSAYVGSITPAGTYTGTIEYQLSSLSGGSGGNGGHNNSGNEVTEEPDTGNKEPGSGTEEPGTGNEEPGTGDNGSGNGGSGNEGPGSGDSGTGNEDPGVGDNSGDKTNGTNDALNNTPSVAPLALSNSYNSYNTYSTTNNYGGGSSVPTATSGQTSGNKSNDATSNNNSGTGDNYEKPLGVTTTTSSSDKDSGIDPMPIVATGAIAVVAVAGMALASSNKKEEDKK